MTSQSDPFLPIARFYDLDFEEYHDDFSFYESLAEYHGDTILEFGCGTGRVAVPLAEAGFQVTGVDLSAAMLAIARRRAGRRVKVTWRRADMLTLDLKQQFALVTVPLGGIQHLETIDQVVACVASMGRHLAPGGVAVVDVEAPHRDDFDPTPQPLVEHWTKPWGQDGQVTKLVSIESRPSDYLKDITWHFDVAGRTGALRRFSSRFTLRTVTLPEIALSARLAGLRVVAAFGDYEFNAFSDFSERLVVLLQRDDEPDPPYASYSGPLG
ncbi:MAG: class I SAM-dependent methyltransferase [Dehalococcoidia bacterium]